MAVDDDTDLTVDSFGANGFVVFWDKNAFGVFGDVLSNAFVENGGLPDDLLTCRVELTGTVDGVTKSVVDDGVGGFEKGFGTNEPMAPTVPSLFKSFSLQVSSSG